MSKIKSEPTFTYVCKKDDHQIEAFTGFDRTHLVV